MDDTYETLEKPSEETLFKDRNSKFFGYAFLIATETDVSLQLDLLKKKHHSARHFCYAWQLGTAAIKYRVNDDGEPNHTGQKHYKILGFVKKSIRFRDVI